jgi:hypothetical protein
MHCKIVCEGHVYFLCYVHGSRNYALGHPYTFLYSMKLLKHKLKSL